MRSIPVKIWLACGLIVSTFFAEAQRSYAPASVLATGEWFKISTREAGIYKIDEAFLRSLGINTSNLSSASIRVFGNGGQMLPESCAVIVADDLQEAAIEVNDGGDGVFGPNDYLIFYAGGVDSWEKDSVNQRFSHKKNIYTDNAFYFITVGGTGKRITTGTQPTAGTKNISSYNEHYYHELDTVNFLNSGKDWFGEEFTSGAGRVLSRNFPVPMAEIESGSAVTVISTCIARSIGSNSRFAVSINGNPLFMHDIAAVTASNLERFASTSTMIANASVSAPLSLSYTYQPGGAGSQGWLDWFEVFARRELRMPAQRQFLFRDWRSVQAGASGEFIVQGADAATRVWDVTDNVRPVSIKTTLNGTALHFLNRCDDLREYIAFTNTGFLLPVAVGKVPNQDLHGLTGSDMVIVAHEAVLPQARRLADFHTNNERLKVAVVTAAQVANEFASGSPDPTALRDFMKMLYDRARGDSSRRPKYLLLFGDASYDTKNRIQRNFNLVPGYQSSASLDPLTTFTTDDYFGFLDDNEDINLPLRGNLLDIGIGRVPVNTAAEATAFVDKVIAYSDKQGLGEWRNHLTFIADDEDFNLHLHDAEIITAEASKSNPLFVNDKIYLDAFPQQSNASGSRYPAVNAAVNTAMQNGTLIWNYNGHGGFRRLAEEVILDQDIVNSWDNASKLPLFITATCDFAPFDNPSITSLGENILLRPRTGAIALMTTTRLVFAYSNRIMNQNYLVTALQRNANGRYLTLGEAVRQAKNVTFQTQSDFINNHKFTLLGDPALTLAFPKYYVQTNTINGKPVSGTGDTLQALQKNTIGGTVTDLNNRVLQNFNGSVSITVYDKPQVQNTLGNDAGSLKEGFLEQRNILFKGRSSVKDGSFSFEFIMPADIRYAFGDGRISYYADNGTEDGNGNYGRISIGGSVGTSTDKKGPELHGFLNDENFHDGATVVSESLLIVHLKDSSGINRSGTGIGHEITAVVDGKEEQRYVLNDFFENDLDTYQQGTIRFILPGLEPGKHVLTVKAWDAANNSSELVIHFVVSAAKSFAISRLINFPNPFRSSTTFRFEHDLKAQDIEVSVRIFSSSGLPVKTINQTINTAGGRSCDIEWDGKNDHQASIRSGGYFYVLKVKTANGMQAQKAGTLVVF